MAHPEGDDDRQGHDQPDGKPQSGGIVSCRNVTIRERFLRFLLGDKQKLTILVPGDTVQELAISEIKEGGISHEQDQATP